MDTLIVCINDIIPVSNAYDSYFVEEYINRNQMLVASKKVVYCLGYHGTGYIFVRMKRKIANNCLKGNDEWYSAE